MSNTMRYLFKVKFTDGTTYDQNPEDTPLAGVGHGSCFSDIQPRINEVKTFSLIGQGHIYLVDLTDGHFEIDGVPFTLNDKLLKDFRLIYFRRISQKLNIQTCEAISEIKGYRFGWQANNEQGYNIQEIIEIK